MPTNESVNRPILTYSLDTAKIHLTKTIDILLWALQDLALLATDGVRNGRSKSL